MSDPAARISKAGVIIAAIIACAKVMSPISPRSLPRLLHWSAGLGVVKGWLRQAPGPFRMSKLDHLAIVAPTLEEGVAYVEKTLGVPMAAGGKHPEMGTHNRLLRLGDDIYLEVIAVDPEAPRPERPRWFGLDDSEATVRRGTRAVGCAPGWRGPTTSPAIWPRTHFSARRSAPRPATARGPSPFRPMARCRGAGCAVADRLGRGGLARAVDAGRRGQARRVLSRDARTRIGQAAVR